MPPLYKCVRSKRCLDRAWQKVYHSALLSKSPLTVDAARQFQAQTGTHIRRIQDQLREERFDFGVARAILVKKAGKGMRPLVVAAIPARIVQRSILDVIQKQDRVQAYILQPGSYGGLRNRSVPLAVQRACEAIRGGARYFIRTDIQGFFTGIPRLQVLDNLVSLLPDASLRKLLDDATHLELDTLGVHGEYLDLFPSYDEGVAQGCCLSPLLGNVLLHDFDLAMNRGEITTLRYIDDFIVLGPSKKSVQSAFGTARKILGRHGFEVYSPLDGGGKAEEGSTDHSFDFLGCSISPGFVQPSRKARSSFAEKVRKELADGRSRITQGAFDDLGCYEDSLLATLGRVSQMLRAWVNQYSFCNGTQVFADVDKKVDELLRGYLGAYSDRRRNLDANARRRLLGVWLAQDGKRKPILPLAAPEP